MEEYLVTGLQNQARIRTRSLEDGIEAVKASVGFAEALDNRLPVATFPRFFAMVWSKGCAVLRYPQGSDVSCQSRPRQGAHVLILGRNHTDLGYGPLSLPVVYIDCAESGREQMLDPGKSVYFHTGDWDQ